MEKKDVRLGQGIGDQVKSTANREMEKSAELLIEAFFGYINERIPELPEKTARWLKQLFSDTKVKQDIVNKWSNQLHEEGIVPAAYDGLDNTLLVHNFHQEGYLSGLYSGYIIAMMSLVDNAAPKDLILSVRDDMRSDLLGHSYDNSEEFEKKYEDEKYSWIDKT